MFDEIKNELIEYGKLIWERGYNPGNCGNFSIRSEDKIIITATNTFKKDLTIDDFVVIDFSGNIIEGSKNPSCETKLHIEYYKQRPDINSVLHVHTKYLSSFAIAGKPLDEPILPDVMCTCGKIPLSEYAFPGTKELIENNKPYFEKHNVILMKNHGVIIAGATIKQAYLNLEICEDYAHKLICAKILGGAKILTDESVREIEELKKGR